MVNGVECVGRVGALLMLVCCVDNWDLDQMDGQHILVKD